MELAHKSNLKASLLSFNIDLQKLSDSYNQGSEDLNIRVSGSFFLPNENFEEYNRLFISIMLYPDENNKLASQIAYEIPYELIGKSISFDYTFRISKKMIHKKINKYFCLSLATTSKHDGEIGINASLEAGKFFENYFPINASDLVGDELNDE